MSRVDLRSCLLAHTYLGKNVAQLTDEEMIANGNGSSNDAKAQFIEIVLHVALNTWTTISMK